MFIDLQSLLSKKQKPKSDALVAVKTANKIYRCMRKWRKKINFSFRLFIFITESSAEITEDSIAAMKELLVVKQQQRDEKKRKKKEEEENAAAEKKKNELRRKYDELQ